MGRLTSPLARCLAVIAVLAAAILPFPCSAWAQSPNRAGLVVVHGDGRQSFVIVQFDGESIPAVEVLDRSGLAVTELAFGALGVAVCDIDGTGCDIATCRKRVCQGPKPDDPFWQYFVRTNDGAWRHSPLGISSESLANGEVQALIWTGTEPQVPAYTIDEVAARAGEIGADGVALTRYDASGAVLTRDSRDEEAVPIAGLVAVGLAATLAVALIVKRQAAIR